MARVPASRVAVALVLSLGLSVWFVASIEWHELAAAMLRVNVGLVLGAAALLVLEFALRALRWKVLLRPVAPEARWSDLFAATLIGAAANTLLPARAGELAKPLVAVRRVGVAFTPLVATAVMERVYDIFGLVSVLLALVWLMPPALANTPEEVELIVNLRRYGAMFGLFAMGCMGVFFALTWHGREARSQFARIVHLAPPAVARLFLVLFDGFVAGLGTARDGLGFVQALVLSWCIWFNGALAIAVLFAAFGLDLPAAAACFTSVAIALTVALPQGPGFVGVFHFAIEKTLVLWRVDPSPAQAFAIVFWGVSFLPVTVLGLGALWREGLTLGRLWSSDGEGAPRPTPQPPAVPE